MLPKYNRGFENGLGFYSLSRADRPDAEREPKKTSRGQKLTGAVFLALLGLKRPKNAASAGQKQPLGQKIEAVFLALLRRSAQKYGFRWTKINLSLEEN